ncbi:hypothetical protein [Lysobacter sp. F6437]|uniref:hypothetical protein n=1 Tax=Lysobacter sp. F6437 TaxID=3459296 RepID=UPI00403DF707
MTRSAPTAAEPIDPRLEDVLRYAIAIGATLLLLVPAARGSSETLGWLPLWLLAMPLSAWWAVHRFRLRAATADHRTHAATRRRSGPQARRRVRPVPRPALPKAA